jgi:hypothetical protein
MSGFDEFFDRVGQDLEFYNEDPSGIDVIPDDDTLYGLLRYRPARMMGMINQYRGDLRLPIMRRMRELAESRGYPAFYDC